MNALLETWREALEYAQLGGPEMDEDGNMTAIEHPRWWALQATFWHAWALLLRATLCRWRGHQLVDDGSYAGPESGADHLRCERCGECWSHIYY